MCVHDAFKDERGTERDRRGETSNVSSPWSSFWIGAALEWAKRASDCDWLVISRDRWIGNTQ